MRFLILLVAVSLCAGCASQGAPPSSLHVATPASNADVARYAEHLLADNYAQDGPGAALIVARGEEVLFRGARGMADVEHAKPLAADSMFDVASITKQFVAAGLSKMVEAGKVSLDDPLSKYVKDFPDGDRITLLELLNHTSGVKNYSDVPPLEEQVLKGMSTTHLIDAFKHETPDFAPGTNWAYDNSGYVLVSAVIEAVSGMPWYEYLQQTLLQPLGLSHTGADPATAARRVTGYVLIDGKPTPARQLSTSQPYADGALVSNVDDLLKWNRALHRGRVLKSDSYRRMITPVGSAIPEQYGFGLWHTTLRDRDMIGHSGHVYGFSAYLLYLPESDISVALLQNMERAPGVADPTETARKLAAFVIGDPYTPAPPIASSAVELRQAEGRYGIDPPGPQDFSRRGARVLRVINGKLTIAHTGGARSELIPIAADAFRTGDGFDRLRLDRDRDGVINGLQIFPWGESAGLLLARMNEPQPTALPPVVLHRVTGTYSTDGMDIRVFLDGEQLKAQAAGQPAGNLFCDASGKCLVGEVDATMDFTPVEGVAQMAVLQQGGTRVEFKRKP